MGKLSGEDIKRLATTLSGTLSLDDLQSFVLIVGRQSSMQWKEFNEDGFERRVWFHYNLMVG